MARNSTCEIHVLLTHINYCGQRSQNSNRYFLSGKLSVMFRKDPRYFERIKILSVLKITRDTPKAMSQKIIFYRKILRLSSDIYVTHIRIMDDSKSFLKVFESMPYTKQNAEMGSAVKWAACLPPCVTGLPW